MKNMCGNWSGNVPGYVALVTKTTNASGFTAQNANSQRLLHMAWHPLYNIKAHEIVNLRKRDAALLERTHLV